MNLPQGRRLGERHDARSRVTGFARDVLLAIAFGPASRWTPFVVATACRTCCAALREGASPGLVPILGEYRPAKARSHAGAPARVLASSRSRSSRHASGWSQPPPRPKRRGGLREGPRKFALTLQMLRISSRHILLHLPHHFAADPQHLGHFKVPAFTPVLLNLSFIGFALSAAPHSTARSSAAWAGRGGRCSSPSSAVPARSACSPAAQGPEERRGARAEAMAPRPSRVRRQVSLVINTHIASCWRRPGRGSTRRPPDEFPRPLLGVAMVTVLFDFFIFALAREAPRQRRPAAYFAAPRLGVRLALQLALRPRWARPPRRTLA